MDMTAATESTTRPIYVIAQDIKNLWSTQGNGVNFGAKPYLDAMRNLVDGTSMYGADDAQMIVMYFLTNAASFRGPEAKALKAELRKAAGLPAK